ncbi:complex proteins associated with Set1p component shg1-domain-containing protein [Lipomyces japonicus]|uniref:complex proteins associated with Set1p component shg1-domain-containing protein n=1 Tax=Lipomyces japonicus TaxID=56871 RepID=UPI0034CD4C0E
MSSGKDAATTTGKPSNGSASISPEDIVNIFKRRGLFDDLRKSLFADYKDSNVNAELIAAIGSIVEQDISATTLAVRNRGKAAALLEGSVNRSEAFAKVNSYVDETISVKNSELSKKVEDFVRQINDGLQSDQNHADAANKSESRPASSESK